MVYRAALLDLDDTTLNRDKSVSCFIDRFLENYAQVIEPAFLPKLQPMFTEIDNKGYTPREEMFLQIRERFDWKAKPNIQTIKEYWEEEMPRCAQPMQGLYETLDFLRGNGLKIAIVTNGSSRMQNAKIDTLGMRGLVDAVVISEEAGFRKPDCRIFELALSKVNAHNTDAFFVGDNPTADIAGAKAAGLTTVWMCGGKHWNAEQYKPDYILESLLDVQQLFR